MPVHLIHGFNVSDGGENTVGKLEPYMKGVGNVFPHDTGWTGLLFLKCNNEEAVAQIERFLFPGSVLIGHSNAGLIIWQLTQKYPDKIAGVILINPALRRDTQWPKGMNVLCLHNSTDWVVQLGRMWARLVSLGGLRFHGWGAAGRYGFDQRMPTLSNWDTASNLFGENRLKGHSGMFEDEKVKHWGKTIARIARGWIMLYAQSRGLRPNLPSN